MKSAAGRQLAPGLGLGLGLGLLFCAAAPRAAAAAAQDEPLFKARHFAAGSGPEVIAAGDLNGDLLPDAVLAANDTRVLLNGGDETLAAPLVSAGAAEDQVLADLDGNGTLDLVQARGSIGLGVPAGLYVRLGNGDGTFAREVQNGVDGTPADVAAGDVDGDGVPDLVSTGDAVRGSLLLGAGDGTFAAALHFGPVDTGEFATSATLDVGDVDGDGLDDVVVLGFHDGKLRTFLSNGDGTFAPPLVFNGFQGHLFPRLGDYDGDGDLDVAFDDANLRLRLLANDGLGVFGGPVIIPLPPSWFPADLRVADLDEDGRDDLIVSIGTAFAAVDALGVVLGAPALAVGEPRWYGAGGNPLQIAVADLDRDGDVDVLTADNLSGTATVLWGEGDGTLWPAYHVPGLPLFVAHGDLDEDGRDDLVAASNDGTLVLLRAIGNGRFAPAGTGLASQNPTGLLLRDVDSDGHLDALVGIDEYNSGQLLVLRGDGAGALGAAVVTPTPRGVASLDAADLDEDGLLDVVALDTQTYELLIEKGDGDGSFSLIGTLPGGGPALGIGRGIVVAQFAGDSHLDIAVVANTFGLTAGRISLLVGHGDGSFDAAITQSAGFVVDELTAGDIDGDGDIDLVGANQQVNSVTLLFNGGNGTFAPIIGYPVGESPRAPTLADVDGDGLLDILTADSHSVAGGTVSVLRGLGGGSFAPAEQVTTGDFPDALVVADLDGDAHADLAVSAGGPDCIEVFINQRGVWDDLGHPLAGSQGLPRMFGIGSLAVGSPIALRLQDGKASGSTALIAGFTEIDAHFKGGILVPMPIAIFFPLPTDAQGNLPLAGTWPPGVGSGVSWYFQYWSPDAAGPHGFSASNAVRGVTP